MAHPADPSYRDYVQLLCWGMSIETFRVPLQSDSDSLSSTREPKAYAADSGDREQSVHSIMDTCSHQTERLGTNPQHHGGLLPPTVVRSHLFWVVVKHVNRDRNRAAARLSMAASSWRSSSTMACKAVAVGESRRLSGMASTDAKVLSGEARR
jgi:hypothetical protein